MAAVAFPPLDVGNRLLVRYYCYHTPRSQVSINSVWYRLESMQIGLTLDGLMNALNSLVSSPYASVLTNDALYIGLDVRLVVFATTTPAIEVLSVPYVYPLEDAGIGGDTSLPTQTCGIISEYTLQSTKAGRGRIYVPFPSVEDMETDGLFSDAYVTGLQDLSDVVFGTGSPMTVVVTAGGGPNGLVSGVHKQGAVNFFDNDFTLPRKKPATHRSRGAYGAMNPRPF